MPTITTDQREELVEHLEAWLESLPVGDGDDVTCDSCGRSHQIGATVTAFAYTPGPYNLDFGLSRITCPECAVAAPGSDEADEPWVSGDEGPALLARGTVIHDESVVDRGAEQAERDSAPDNVVFAGDIPVHRLASVRVTHLAFPNERGDEIYMADDYERVDRS